MSELNRGRAKTWNIYSSSSSSRSSPNNSQTNHVINKEGSWKSFGTSMNAISFGFVATAILISMFLIMAIFEHLFRPTATSSSHDHHPHSRHHDHGMESSRHIHKLGNPDIQVQTSHASDFSVVMPGHQCPTFIARPAPLPCRREGASWPSHEHSLAQP